MKATGEELVEEKQLAMECLSVNLGVRILRPCGTGCNAMMRRDGTPGDVPTGNV